MFGTNAVHALIGTCAFDIKGYSLAVESKKRAERRRNWYSNDIGIKICEMFHTITYTKST